MVTQCTACQVWFKVTREHLHAAHGLVRCSACNTVFNALATLRHDTPEGAVLAGSTTAVGGVTAVGVAQPSSREDEIPKVERGADAEPAEKQSRARGDDEDTMRDGLQLQPADESGSPGGESYLGMPIEEPGPQPESESVPEIAQEADSSTSAQETLNELDLYLATALDDTGIDKRPTETRDEMGDTDTSSGPTAPPEEALDSQRGADISEVELEAGKTAAQQGIGEENRNSEMAPMPATERGERWQRRLWSLVLGLASLALAGQIVYAQREALGRMFGQPRSAPVLRQYAISGAALDAAQQGVLVLKGALVNQGRRAQPLPLIRVTLTDRYGDTVGARILSPPQYGAGQKTLLQAHQHFMFHVKLADPGSSAVGFSLVLCKHRGHSILCQDS